MWNLLVRLLGRDLVVMRCVAKPDMMYISGVEGGQGSQGIVTHSSGPPEWEGSKKIVRHWLRGVQS